MHQVKLSNFNGPLHLLLSLIEERQIDISEIALADVTEQFLKYLNNGQLEPEELADWLVVAAKLLWIKSQTLLPGEVDIEADPGELARQLKIYKAYLDALKGLEKIIRKRKHCYVRLQPVKDLTPRFTPPPSLLPDQLAEVYRGILARLTPLLELPKVIMEKTITIQEKIKKIQAWITKKLSAKFSELLEDKGSRTERIVSFLAILELVKMRVAEVEQAEHLQEIHIKML